MTDCRRVNTRFGWAAKPSAIRMAPAAGPLRVRCRFSTSEPVRPSGRCPASAARYVRSCRGWRASDVGAPYRMRNETQVNCVTPVPERT
jgi:hypothetical protein